MKQVVLTIKKLLYPPVWVLICVPVLSFAALTAIFICKYNDSAAAYIVYSLSAYSLTVWVAAAPRLMRRIKSAALNSKPAKKIAASKAVVRYLSDAAFRGSISVYFGMVVDFLYAVFRAAAGIRYSSAWFISMAAYYLALGVLRAYLIIGYRRRTPLRECRCYCTAAWLLFLLNIPMGGMIILMVKTNSGFSYPGYVIYLSAIYTFYTVATSVINLVKFRRLGSPILSAAKVLNFVAAMMSVLGLQTAMISRFSENSDGYRRMMNAITGGVIYGAVILIAVCMLLHGRKLKEQAKNACLCTAVLKL